MKLKNFLKENKITQKQLAEKVGCSPGAISHYCTGRSFPRPDTARKIEAETKRKVLFSDLYAGAEKQQAA